ncbi:MAG TPA: DNA cytosine methyltransferase, partial [Baekduia sp.]|nr:DNA cytosine methyltransferase [Baekduia sp.]
MTIGSLFSGIGGLERGLEMCGLGPVRWQCDSDPCARAVLAQHWPEVKRFEDVREVARGKAERVDIVCGGFPCQPVSVAGKRKAQRDTRWLWPHF